MHNEREKGWDEIKAVYKAATLSARIWKTESNSSPSYTKEGSTLYWLRSSSCPCNETTGMRQQSVFSYNAVEHVLILGNCIRKCPGISQSATWRAVRCTQQIKFPPVHDVPVRANIFQQFFSNFIICHPEISERLYLTNISQLFRWRIDWFEFH